MPDKSERQERFFKTVTPLQAMRLSLAMILVFMCIAVAAAIGWCFSRTVNNTVTYEYKTIMPQEYLEKNGTSVLSYDKNTNQIAFMMTEDLINTMVNQYMEEQDYMLGEHKVYEIVYRQKEGKFHIQIQSGLFRVPVQAAVSASWDEASQELVLTFSRVQQGENENFWGSWLSAPQLPSLRIPASFLNLAQWQSISGVELNTNEMLLYISPDLSYLASAALDYIQPDEVYLDWQTALADCPQLVQRLQSVKKGAAIREIDVRNFLKIMIDQQEELIPILAVMDQTAAARFIEEYQPFLTEEVTLEACASRRNNIKQSVKTAAARQLLYSLEDYIEQGIGVEPMPMEKGGDSVDNSYVNFTDGARLEGTAMVIQIASSPQPEEGSWAPEQTFITDAGVIYDYNQSAFITPQWIAQQYPLSIPHVDFLEEIRFYYQCENGQAAALVMEDGGNVRVITDTGFELLSEEAAQEKYPEYKRTPVLASVPDMESDERASIVESIQQQLDEGEILTRYMAASATSAFVVFSTAEHAERIRSAVLSYQDGAWDVLDYDISYYLEYSYFHPEINGTIFPLETIQDLTVRTIPAAGLQLIMDKAIQLNLANKNQTIDYYYYIDSYIYTHFSSGKQCVFQVGKNEEILACRSVESAENNWDLPAFFILEDSRS